MTIEQSLKQSSLPLFEKEILLADLLKKDRSFLHSHSEVVLTTRQEKQFLNRIARRENNEPVAYILGYQEFYDRKFLVNKDVLIPRADTEILVEYVLNHVGDQRLTIVDVGTGSGCIPITLARLRPNLKIIATEISKEALNVAKKNAKLHKVSERIEFIECSLMEDVNEKVDVIVANLPYIPTENWKKLPGEIKDWEPRVALESWESKTNLYEKLFEQSKDKLNNNGIIFYEIDGEVFTRTA